MRREPKIKDLNYQLGNYVGEYITRRFLPTLSTDMLKTHTEIKVSKQIDEWQQFIALHLNYIQYKIIKGGSWTLLSEVVYVIFLKNFLRRI